MEHFVFSLGPSSHASERHLAHHDCNQKMRQHGESPFQSQGHMDRACMGTLMLLFTIALAMESYSTIQDT